MLPQENLGVLGVLRCFLVHSEAISSLCMIYMGNPNIALKINDANYNIIIIKALKCNPSAPYASVVSMKQIHTVTAVTQLLSGRRARLLSRALPVSALVCVL